MKKILSLLILLLLGGGGVYLLKVRKAQVAALPTPEPEPLVLSVARPRPMEVNESREFLGRYSSLRKALLGTKIPGFIDKIHVEEGERVSQGKVLVELDRSEVEAQIEGARSRVEALREEIRGKRALLRAARIDEKNTYESLQRDRKLYRVGGLSREKLEMKETLYEAKRAQTISLQGALRALQHELRGAQKALEAKRRLLNYTEIKAPYDGVVGTIFLKEGSFAPLGKPLVEVLGDPFVIDLPFSGGVEKGMVALVQGRVCRVETILPQTPNGLPIARIRCRERLPLPEGSEVKVQIVKRSVRGLALPLSALYEREGRYFVFIRRGREYHPVEVEIEVLGESHFIPKPPIEEPVAVGSREKLGRLFLKVGH
ncbi:MAG: biotin/lipoyl-binding protein [Epsilonproteobacteria bacterium]|nr:hypothetical protein [Campylobacterota bacterium]NPA57397.1 biotin/lipoyl-binding protein [Campylobacterota bacterium]